MCARHVGLKVTNQSYRTQAGIDNQSAKIDLKNLVMAGFLEAHGERRGRFYLAGAPLKTIRAATRVPEEMADPFAKEAPQPPSPLVQSGLFASEPRSRR